MHKALDSVAVGLRLFSTMQHTITTVVMVPTPNRSYPANKFSLPLDADNGTAEPKAALLISLL